MRQLITLLFILSAFVSYGQIQDFNITTRPGQSTGDPYIMSSDTTGAFAGRGRWCTISYIADLLQPYISAGAGTNFAENDLSATGDRAHDFNNNDLTIDSVGNFNVFSRGPNAEIVLRQYDGSNGARLLIEGSGPHLISGTSDLHVNANYIELQQTEGMYQINGRPPYSELIRTVLAIDTSDGFIKLNTQHLLFSDTTSTLATQYDLTQITSPFNEITTDDAPTYQDSAYREGYTEFRGTSNGEDTRIKLLKDGVLVFDKQQFGDDVEEKYLTFYASDTLNTGLTFNISNSSVQSIQDTTFNLESTGIGWNAAPGGTPIVAGRSALELRLEYNWSNPNDNGNLWDEFQLRWIDPDGNQRRPIDFAMKHGNEEGSEGAIRLPKIDFSPLDTTAWYAQYQYVPATARIAQKFANPLTGNGYQMIMDEDDNTVEISQFGMDNPAYSFNDWYQVNFTNAFVKVPTRTGNNASYIAGFDASHYMTDITADWGVNLSGTSLIADSSEVATQYDLTLIGGADGDGIYDGSGTVPSATVATLTDYLRLEGTGINPYLNIHAVNGTNSALTLYSNGTTGNTVASDGFYVGLNSQEKAILSQRENNAMGFSTNNTERLTIAATGELNASVYDATPPTGTPFALLAHETDGDVISATWPQVVDSLEANGLTGGGSSAPYTISPAQITADQDNYAPTGIGIATYVRLSTDSDMQAITGIVDSVAGTLEKTLINIGSYMIYLPMDHPDSDAAHRFTGYPGDYYLYPGASCKILYDVTSTKWRVMSGDAGYTRPTVYYAESAGSATAGDHSSLGILAINSGSISTSVFPATLPGAWTISTASTTNGGGALYFAKSLSTIAAFESAHIFGEATISFTALSNGTDTYTTEVQIINVPTSTSLEVNNMFGVRYSDGINSGKLELFSQDNAGSETVADLGVTVAISTIYKIRLEVDKSNSECRAYVNGAYAGRVTGTMPSAGVCSPRIVHLKSAGTGPTIVRVYQMNAGAIYP